MSDVVLHRHREVWKQKPVLRQLYDQSAQLATRIAGNLLKREITPQDHRRLVEDALVEIGNGSTLLWRKFESGVRRNELINGGLSSKRNRFAKDQGVCQMSGPENKQQKWNQKRTRPEMPRHRQTCRSR